MSRPCLRINFGHIRLFYTLYSIRLVYVKIHQYISKCKSHYNPGGVKHELWQKQLRLKKSI
jgi:hypothetical protein